jgi:hypothetical protein
MAGVWAVMAHPDEAELGSGKTLYRHAVRGDWVEIRAKSWPTGSTSTAGKMRCMVTAASATTPRTSAFAAGHGQQYSRP